MNKKTYTVNYEPIGFSIDVEIDHKKTGETWTNELIKLMVEHWTGSEDLLNSVGGDYTKAFLKQLCRECFRLVVANNYNLYGVVSEFEDSEGYCNMDGTYGIKITRVSKVNYNLDGFLIGVKKENK